MEITNTVDAYGTQIAQNQSVIEQTLIDSTNVAAATNYYPSAAGISMEGFSKLAIQGMIAGGVTATVEASLDNAASPDFVDITKAGTDLITNVVGGASFVDANFLLNYSGLAVRRVRIKSVTSDASNSVQINLIRQR